MLYKFHHYYFQLVSNVKIFIFLLASFLGLAVEKQSALITTWNIIMKFIFFKINHIFYASCFSTKMASQLLFFPIRYDFHFPASSFLSSSAFSASSLVGNVVFKNECRDGVKYLDQFPK